MVVSSWLSRREDDRFAAESCGLSVPRQNGKNALLEVRELYGMVATGEKFLHTAHQVKTAKKAFKRLAGFFEDKRYPELSEMVVSIRRTNGEEMIELSNGGSIEFSARSRGSARGFTVDTVVFDEAQELTDEQMEALLPTLAAAPSGNRQFIYTGTPPGPGSPGTVFGRTREAAISGIDKTLAWHEWSVEEVGDTSDRSRWYETNPALGIRIDESFCEKEHITLTPDGFARERLGWWSPADKLVEHVIDPTEWSACETDDPPTDGLMAAAVKFSADGLRGSLAICVRQDDGHAYVEAESHTLHNGVGWFADFIAKRKSRIASVAIDGKAGAASLATKLSDMGVPKRAFRICASGDVAAANSMLVGAVRDRSVAHFGQPALNDAATKCAKRRIGSDGFGFDDTDEGDSTLIEACALAYREAMTTRRKPGRKAVVY